MKKSFSVAIILVTSLFSKTISLDEAIKTALNNNKKQIISKQDRAIAKARYNQALSANYPTLDISLLANRHDEAFIDEVHSSYKLDNSLPLVGGQEMPLNYTHTVMGRDTLEAKAELKYLLYSGGKISSYQKQAKAGISYAQENAKLTNDEIIYNIKKYYAGAVLAKELKQLMEETLKRFQAVYDLTETFYKGKSLSVKKTDFLKTKMTLLNIKSMYKNFQNSYEIAKSALKFEMGINQSDPIDVDKNSLKIYNLDGELKDYYQKLYLYNHQLKNIKTALEVKNAKIDEAKSDYLPVIALYANAKTLHNNEKGGIINSQNNDSWNIGAVIKYNLFSGGLTYSKTQEAKAQKLKLQAQKAYLKSGLELKAKKAFLNTKTALEKIQILKEAKEVSKENANLNFRAYQEEMASTKDVLEAQFMDSLTKSAYYKAIYDAYINEANLEFIIGKSLNENN
jgi:outer membrane protein TolC